MLSDHSHPHHHDEACSCGCHGDHQHTPHPARNPISVKTHDTSVVGSYQFELEGSFAEAEAVLEVLLKRVAKDVLALGGIIGHIKAVVKSDGETCMISITEDEANKHHNSNSCCRAEGVAIVFAVLPEQLEAILNTAFQSYLI